ncbi:TlpA disulfide reductase family protein [Ancylomarina sp. 16SWW S1-10-2]|uniref:TlpA family protein disulfide reductase n=1 Tax=Ancylomarina sp. 16SWW S1-10-2 TaxID=2499681 RepID=UPI0012AEA3CE|nr:TlpA disulfide reductase family protein [Ancylomarina sp. 16SWW S1-10-2]MRT92327.1 TlpA family protein disulfide reductase [Ancylomarina sp. 16SWW S1-10-2]
MNRKTAILSIAVILVILIGVVIKTQQIKRENELAEETKVELTQIPKFNFQDTLGRPFTQANLQIGKPTLVIHFGNFCPYCHKETKIISHYFGEYEDFQLVFVTKDKKPNIIAFMEKNKLTNKSNITVLRYENNEFEEAFGSKSLPCVFIFNKQFQLIKHFDGAVTARTLIKYTRAAKI